ncbi:tRNA(Met) cytidine acetyltransferase TmcA [Photobacterium nomapromontoriensis]|uniref:tRNA(Met) cytidine acetyltransferase TmcA n=1 Tax=Photobacterium nomapromontoriensis TaxID=2910237 RepID=UPI003D1532AF
MNALNDFCVNLSSIAKQRHCRYLVVAQGSEEWGKTIAHAFCQTYPRALVCGGKDFIDLPVVSFKKAKQWLGRECDCLIFNAHDGFHPEAFGALSGTIVGGGILLLLLPADFRHDPCSAFNRRIGRLFRAPEVVVIEQNSPLPSLATCLITSLSSVPVAPNSVQCDDLNGADSECYGALTACQADAISAVRRVVTGHRKRPLVLTADRGRGKSSALGLAAASLLAERKINIVVTAPSFAAAETLFRHVAEQFSIAFDGQKRLAVGLGQITFVAPDLLVSDNIAADCLLVDEAAAIPAPLLSAMLSRYSRIAFASTVHGYEGTGRGFAVKFRQLLDVVTPQWRAVVMHQPIRWAVSDPLEEWVFKALMLDAEMAEFTDQPLVAEQLSYIQLKPQLLETNDTLLSQLFGLLVNAHYQTSPSDLVSLLDDPNLHVFAALSDQSVVGCCLVMEEGQLDAELVSQIQIGKRRIQGHLMAQSLATHLGISEAATQHSGRILRIAIVPDFQQRGIGSRLLQEVQVWAAPRLDFLGTSYGYVPELLSFWQANGYQPVRLGLTKDATSGYPSLLSLMPLSAASAAWFNIAKLLFSASIYTHAADGYDDMSPMQLLPLYLNALQSREPVNNLPSSLMYQQLDLYCRGGLGFEIVLPALVQWFEAVVPKLYCFDVDNLELVLAKVMQRKSWSYIVEHYNLNSRKQAEQLLRQFVANNLPY